MSKGNTGSDGGFDFLNFKGKYERKSLYNHSDLLRKWRTRHIGHALYDYHRWYAS